MNSARQEGIARGAEPLLPAVKRAGPDGPTLTRWQQWRDHPEQVWLRNAAFQIHFWVGAIVGVYILLMSVSGSLLVYRNELSRHVSVEWLADLHENLSAGSTGRLANGIGAISLLLLCATGALIWWPGVQHWRRSVTVEWSARFPRLNWDVHSSLGFWCFGFILMWAVSAVYLVFPKPFDLLLLVDPTDHVTDQGLFWLAQLHSGGFSRFARPIWLVLGLTPAVLAFTGVFICCRRVMYGKPSNPRSASIG